MSKESSVFENPPDNLDFSKMEDEILAWWEETKAFETSVQQSLEEKRPEYTFYDGPPFATGLPHYGHILAGTIKDVVTRYQHLNGFHVSRRFGWDCHGLPVEYAIDQKLGIKSSDDVMAMGIKAYNAECRSIVDLYCSEWETIVKRMGRWIDFQNCYRTMQPTFMESVWWVFKTIYEKDLVYQGFRVMPYSTACSTPLSNFEAGSNYKDTTDPAVVVSFPTEEDPQVSFLAWTTTPWTLISNIALCVHPEFTYVHVKDLASGKQYILAEERLPEIYPKMKKQKDKYKGGEFEIVKKMKGAELKGKRYTPLFPYFKDHPNAFQVLNDEYVTNDSGTGIVHQAPGFGEDDYRVCMAHGVIVPGGEVPCPIDNDGRFTENIKEFAGTHVKAADEEICKTIKTMDRLVTKGSVFHSYPFCWRSDTPLIYRAIPSWFVKLEPIKEQLLKNNAETYWVPSNVKEKRFHNWLENARDWNISRNRYWGTPIPIWMSEDGEEIVVIGSIEELETLSGQKIEDLHREYIDDIEIPSKKGKGMLRRIPEVFDCWFESGSMPYAQQHYPFENKERFENGFPADFIAEGLDQTRGWFYTLMVLSTALFDKPAFKNLIVNGLVLAADGKKMSKRLKNYPDPMHVVHKYGADSLRLYLINSPVVRAEPLRFQEDGVLKNLKEIFIPWFNVYRFFVQQTLRVELDQGYVFDRSNAESLAIQSTNVMDKWIIASLNHLIDFTRQEMEAYRLYTVVPKLVAFVTNLTNWYLRLNRSRLKGFDTDLEDTKKGLACTYVVLLTLSKLMAPFTPFMAEYTYRKLVRPADGGESSVHFLRFPEANKALIDKDIEERMNYLQEAVSAGRLARGNDHPMKRPLRELILVHEQQSVLDGLKSLERFIKIELNVQTVTYTTEEKKYCRLSAKADGSVLGKKLGKKFGLVNKGVQQLTHDQLVEFQNTGSMEIEGETLTLEEVFLNRDVLVDTSKFSAKTTPGKLTVVLDTYVDQKLVGEQTAREFVSRVQKLRKAAGVKLQDVLNVFYSCDKGAEEGIKNFHQALKDNEEYLVGLLRFPPSEKSACPSYARILGSTTEEIGEDVTVTIDLALPCPIMQDVDKLAQLLGEDEKTAKNITNCISSMDYEWLCENADKSLEVTIDGKFVKLERGKHYFLSAQEKK